MQSCDVGRLLGPLLFSMALVASPSLGSVPTISNDCGVECFPCMGPADIFCRDPSPPWPVPDAPFCTLCFMGGTHSHCDNAMNGETGMTSCSLVYEGSTLKSCAGSGSFCSSITVNP
jgi:hypothetical protein